MFKWVLYLCYNYFLNNDGVGIVRRVRIGHIQSLRFAAIATYHIDAQLNPCSFGSLTNKRCAGWRCYHPCLCLPIVAAGIRTTVKQFSGLGAVGMAVIGQDKQCAGCHPWSLRDRFQQELFAHWADKQHCWQRLFGTRLYCQRRASKHHFNSTNTISNFSQITNIVKYYIQ